MNLYLVDAHALAYRAHFAFAGSPLVDSRGRVTSAVFGFARTILALLDERRPDHVAVVFDPPGKTFRHGLYPEYKATREKMPEEMADQIPLLHDLLRALRVTDVTIEGFEADDVVATLAAMAEEAGFDVRILSGDKDFFQLLSERVHLLRPDRRFGGLEEIGPSEFRQRFGFAPDRMTDYLGLTGDSSDNVPGVPGVGEKTARALLGEFDDLESLLAGLERVESPALRRKLERNADQARLSKHLVTMRRDVRVGIDLEGLRRREPDRERLTELFLELDFRSLLKRAAATPSGGGAALDYGRVRTEAELRELARELEAASEWSLDVETTSLDAMSAELVGISFSTRAARARYLPVAAGSSPEAGGPLLEGIAGPPSEGFSLEDVRRELGPLLADPSRRKVGQNIKYDWLVLENHGLPLSGVAFDTMIASYCLDPGRGAHNLESLALEFLGRSVTSYADLFPRRTGPRDIRSVPLEKLAAYACEDAEVTLGLKERLEPRLGESGVDRLFAEIEMPLVGVIVEMEREGVALDGDFLDRMSRRMTSELGELEAKAHRLAGEPFNLNSTPQLRRVLFEKLGLKPGRRTKTGYSTDAEVLAELGREHELPRRLLEYRELQKLKSTYVDALPRLVNRETGRLHTSYNQAVAATGRLSSSDPNLQNIPIRTPMGREIRRAFVPRRGFERLLDADYSQIELRILAHLTGDESLREAFREGADIHRRTASTILGVKETEVTGEMRSRAKAVNFGVIYGMGPRGLASSLGIPVEEAEGFIAEYFATYPAVRSFIDTTVEQARRDGYVTTLLGRRRYLPDIDSENGRARSFSERVAVNTRVQGTAADMIKVAMIRVHDRIHGEGLDSRMILQVHDELVFDVKGGEEEALERLVREEMASGLELSVPVVVDTGFGSSWFDAH
jgi:DNA polymerase-1